jgi:hypothetical protein
VTGNIDTTSDLYKVFHRASTRNLLYLQTRVAALQQKQIKFDQEDYKFRIKNWDSRFHVEDEILDNFFSPSKELLQELKKRLESLELLEVEVSKWEESIRLRELGRIINVDSPTEEAIHRVPDGNPVVGDSIQQPDTTAPPVIHGDTVEASGEDISPQRNPSQTIAIAHFQPANDGVSSGPNEKRHWFRCFRKEGTQESSSVELGDLGSASVEQTSVQTEPNAFDEVYIDIHVHLDGLEGSRNNSPLGLPSLPQDLSWGPVSDRGPQVSSRVPNDFMLHRECIYQHPFKHGSFQVLPGAFFDRQRQPSFQATEKNTPRNKCICYRAYRESRKEYHAVLEEGLQARKGGKIVQMFHQRIRVLEDYYRGLWTIHGQTSRLNHNIPEDKLPKPTQPSLAIMLAAKSWEDFEIFGSAVKMWERRRSWDQLDKDQPWPFDMSDEWIGKMRERFNVARDMRVAIKEYRKFFILRRKPSLYDDVDEALVLQSQVMAFDQPAPRIITNVSHQMDPAPGDGVPQFRHSGRELLSKHKDLRMIESGPGDGPFLVRELSEYFATKMKKWFLVHTPFCRYSIVQVLLLTFLQNPKLSISNHEHISETKIYSAVTGVILFLLILFLVIATWIVKVLGDLIVTEGSAKYYAFITDMQLMVITLFMLAFSVFLVFLGASRFEAFTATAAYAAVLVIFMAPATPYVSGQ